MFASLAGCTSKQESDVKGVSEGMPSKQKIFTSFYPLYFAAKEIAGDKAEVINLTPAGAEPHDWEPTARTIIEMQTGAMFIYNGLEMEGWAEKVIETLDKAKTRIVCASDGIELIKSGELEHEHDEHEHDDDEHHDEDEQEDEDEHHHGEFDPHIWVSPVRFKKQAQNIMNALAELDPENKEYYIENFMTLAAKLDKLDADIRKAVKEFKSNIIITSHDAFGYFAYDYGLEQIAIRGVSPDDEPSPAKMAKLVDECREHGVKFVFFEKLVNPKLSQTLAREIGGQTLVLNAVHGVDEEEQKQGKDYISVMYENLDNFKKALKD